MSYQFIETVCACSKECKFPVLLPIAHSKSLLSTYVLISPLCKSSREGMTLMYKHDYPEGGGYEAYIRSDSTK